jgi:CheY-like chemotaxis protein
VARRGGKRSGPPRVLVVDDEPGTVEVLLMVLADAGYRATGTGHGRDALASMAAEPVDVVLLDLIMPVMDGSATLRALRGDPRWAKLPVILMSGIPEPMARRRCPGADAFLRKPFALDELVTAVAQVVRRSADPKPVHRI